MGSLAFWMCVSYVKATIRKETTFPPLTPAHTQKKPARSIDWQIMVGKNRGNLYSTRHFLTASIFSTILCSFPPPEATVIMLNFCGHFLALSPGTYTHARTSSGLTRGTSDVIIILFNCALYFSILRPATNSQSVKVKRQENLGRRY